MLPIPWGLLGGVGSPVVFRLGIGSGVRRGWVVGWRSGWRGRCWGGGGCVARSELEGGVSGSWMWWEGGGGCVWGRGEVRRGGERWCDRVAGRVVYGVQV